MLVHIIQKRQFYGIPFTLIVFFVNTMGRPLPRIYEERLLMK